ncbi:putative antitoxin VapB45 [Tsukamurella pulmonis]|uniref:DUF433 domain-containing protein n=1 Tax=Tsukamurella pulmonis TaxID=47312 RepID=UPI001EE018C4|nr:DUF433 domain-containing protein [Tsukamurella pulmonis]BDD80290.1 putative antitoxin VapB45 [Tsukamurella pulmonis]
MAGKLTRDIRFTSPICTPAEAAILAGMPAGTVRSWVRPTATRGAIVHSIEPERVGWPSLPLVGVIETWSMRALRRSGVPMQKLRRVAESLQAETGDPYVLARPVLFTDGIDLYRRERGDLFRVEDGQQPIEEVIEDYLSRVELDPAQDPTAFRVPLTEGVALVMDPSFNAGRPTFERTRTAAFAVLGSLEAGDAPAIVAHDYGLTAEEVSAVEHRKDWLAEFA